MCVCVLASWGGRGGDLRVFFLLGERIGDVVVVAVVFVVAVVAVDDDDDFQLIIFVNEESDTCR